MRAVRAIITQKFLLNPAKHEPFSRLSIISFQPILYLRLSRHFHSTNRSHCAEESSFRIDFPITQTQSKLQVADRTSKYGKNRRTWAVYDPVSGSLHTQRVASNIDGRELEQNSGSESENAFSNSEDEVEDLTEKKTYGSAKKVNSVSGLGHGSSFGDTAGKKKGKGKTFWVCSSCGYTDGQWWGYCRECKASGSMTRFCDRESSGGKVSGIAVSENLVGSWLPQLAGDLRPLRLTDVNRGVNQLDWRIPMSGLFGTEVARVLGGGIVPGSLVLVGGDPGVGKSTLLLQIAAMIAEGHDLGGPAPVVYVSGEESVEQIGNRADRLKIETEELFLYSSTDIEDIFEKIQHLSPRALVVDSIQTVHLKGVVGSAGGITQVKECTSALLRFAKKTKVPVLLIGHVTKSGDVAGPRVLEHIVDVVLYMEGEKYSSHRLLRPVKNRFGSTDELGVFEMSQLGLQGVSNPSEMFISEQFLDSELLAGLAVAVIMDGSRTFLLEIQALCVSGSTTNSRQVNGILASRAEMIISVLVKQANLRLQENAVFLNVVSGVKLTETAGDLAIAAAICSSFLEFPLPNNIAFIGEIGLGGELRMVPRMEKRVNTVAKLGYKMCIVPKAAEESFGPQGFADMKLVGCKNLKEVINTVFIAQ
ncbi:DNA repair protein RadA [Quillaja saponaria]|uniref:DNA repair protein RadA n=1 Tax=Quillaja saponaria TaxID=32244 RepID=A0AAD7PDL4_QUISA|nr:DNA repair protein RadA [Quillaja saponaria]